MKWWRLREPDHEKISFIGIAVAFVAAFLFSIRAILFRRRR
jgi:hypothetical protein